jgi:hypothetical protein
MAFGRRTAGCMSGTAIVSILIAMLAAPGAGAATPTKASWATAADATCRSANAAIRRLPKITSTTVLLTDLRATGRIAASLDAKLTAIPRPSVERRPIASLLATSRTETRLILEQLVPALERGDQSAASRLVNTSDKLGTQFNRLARALGARVCAENPEPSG